MAYERNMAQIQAYKQQASQEQQKLKDAMGKIKHKIAIISGKGGVGKSTVTVNLATAFAMQGKRVGVLDADIHGPSVPRLLGLEGQQAKTSPTGVFPVDGVPLRVATESGTVIERSKQDYGFPVTVGGKDLAFAFVKV